MCPNRHDHDAGGAPEILERKARLRDRIWALLEENGAARFPGAEGRIPNFTGAEAAAERLRDVPAWAGAEALKANPDSPQWPVRQRALEAGEDPFFLLDPDEIGESPRKASSIKGASRNARTVAVAEVTPVDLVVVGCVAVSRDGARLGKGGGFSDLEYALALEAGLLTEETPVLTTVHPLQVLDEGEIPMTGHDVPLDVIVTPDEVIETSGTFERPAGIRWEDLTDEKVEAIPLLERLRRERRARD